MNTTLGNSESVESNSINPRRCKTITNDVRSRLIDAHEAGLTYKRMYQLFGVKVDTAYRICSLRKYQVKNRGGSRGKKLNDTDIHFLLENVESRPDITAQRIEIATEFEGGICFSEYDSQMSGREINYNEKIGTNSNK